MGITRHVMNIPSASHDVEIVLGKVKVIAADAINCSRGVARERAHRDRSAPTAKIAQQECDSETRREF